ncbi:MAG: thiamine diphosphokinase [Eubacterium sp.]|nr:thiamine diphosphokinase [Eubacterium sp.]
MRCLIVAGGEVDRSFLRQTFDSMDDVYVIGADKGVVYASEAGIKIDKAIGDFDSVSTEEKIRITELYDTELLIPEKDDTDTEHALKYAIDMCPEEIIMMGCTGSRLDHTFSSVRILKNAYDAGISAYLLNKTNRIRIAKGELYIKKENALGKYISIMPYGDKAEGITLKGFKYPLENYTLPAEKGLGISNEITSDEAYICSDDYLIIMETID